MKKNNLAYFQKVQPPDPADFVIEQIHMLIRDRKLLPGERLPSEKMLEERMGLPRGVISKALKRLETFGIVKTIPQSGSYIAEIESEALASLIANVSQEQTKEYSSIAEVRKELEEYAVEQVVRHATDEEIAELERVQQELENSIRNNDYSFEKDMIFHLKIAAFSQNIILKSILTGLNVDMLDILNALSDQIGKENVHIRLLQAMDEHKNIIKAIKSRSVQDARKAMADHFISAGKFRKQYE